MTNYALALFGIVIVFAIEGCMNCPKYVTNPTITSRNGVTLCARHHIPLVTVNGYSEQREKLNTFQDSVYMQVVVETCNPNFIMPWHSLRRTARCPVPTKVTYCPLCERAVAANRARPDAMRKPSWWEEFITGVHVIK